MSLSLRVCRCRFMRMAVSMVYSSLKWCEDSTLRNLIHYLNLNISSETAAAAYTLLLSIQMEHFTANNLNWQLYVCWASECELENGNLFTQRTKLNKYLANMKRVRSSECNINENWTFERFCILGMRSEAFWCSQMNFYIFTKLILISNRRVVENNWFCKLAQAPCLRQHHYCWRISTCLH